jgi:hypothetical protein
MFDAKHGEICNGQAAISKTEVIASDADFATVREEETT